MPFIRKPGFKGKIYVPDCESPKNKKHNCSDCFSCLNCSDSRCELCINQKECSNQKHKRKDEC